MLTQQSLLLHLIMLFQTSIQKNNDCWTLNYTTLIQLKKILNWMQLQAAIFFSVWGNMPSFKELTVWDHRKLRSQYIRRNANLITKNLLSPQNEVAISKQLLGFCILWPVSLTHLFSHCSSIKPGKKKMVWNVWRQMSVSKPHSVQFVTDKSGKVYAWSQNHLDPPRFF